MARFGVGSVVISRKTMQLQNSRWGIHSSVVFVKSRAFGAGNEIDAVCVLVTTLELINILSDRASNGLQL